MLYIIRKKVHARLTESGEKVYNVINGYAHDIREAATHKVTKSGYLVLFDAEYNELFRSNDYLSFAICGEWNIKEVGNIGFEWDIKKS